MVASLKILMYPGVQWMRRLRVPFKLGVMGVLLLLPLLSMTASQYRTLRDEAGMALAERDGAREVAALTTLVTAVQSARGLTNRALSGDASALEPLGRARTAIAEALGAVDAIAAGPRRFAPVPGWPALREAVDALAAGRLPSVRAEAFEAHSKAVEALRATILRVGEDSGLLLDPRAMTYHLMEVAVQRMVPLMEAVGLARGGGSAAIARREASGPERARVLGRAEGIARQLADVRTSLEAAQRAGAAIPATWAALERDAREFVRQLESIFTAEAITGEPQAFFDAGTAAITAATAPHGDVLGLLDAALAERAASAERRLRVEMGIAAVAVVFVTWLGLSFYASFNGALRQLHRGVDAVAAGDLSHRLVIEGRDEMAEIGGFVERMSDRLSAMVAEIRSSAMRVGMSGRALAEDAATLSRRSSEQAESLRATLATARALGEAVAANAAAAGELDRLTGKLRTDAEAGGQAMVETVDSMAKLQHSSRRVGEIVSVIDGIAFQTNILALNAAVEAARAGEQGRGFAVVATEVRTLAQRSAAAAREIKSLIAESTGQVDASVGRIRHVGEVLESLVRGVRTASERLRELSSTSARQSTDLQQVARSVGDLDEVTRANAAIVEQSAQASRDLVVRAEALTGAVSSIRLRQGSADEATALVARALARVRAEGLAGASSVLHSATEGYVDRDLYVFVIDRVGRYLLHGARPDMEGRRVHEVPGIDGDRFLRDAWAAATAGSGWIDYDIVNPKTGVVQPKTSYVVGLDANTLMGCGIYRRVDIAATA
jgi:methyl-accepting chemotaxis protein